MGQEPRTGDGVIWRVSYFVVGICCFTIGAIDLVTQSWRWGVAEMIYGAFMLGIVVELWIRYSKVMK